MKTDKSTQCNIRKHGREYKFAYFLKQLFRLAIRRKFHRIYPSEEDNLITKIFWNIDIPWAWGPFELEGWAKRPFCFPPPMIRPYMKILLGVWSDYFKFSGEFYYECQRKSNFF
jgi:hypothetical protein